MTVYITGVTEPPAKKKRGAWPLYLIFIALAALMVVGIHSTGRARRAAKAYVAAIQGGELDTAYSMLTQDRQREIIREAFEHGFRTPELMAGKRPAWDYASNGSNGQACAEAGISIDGEVEGWFTDDTPKRFESYGWLVIRNVDGHDADEIKTAIETAHKSSQPTLICCKTTIGFGSPNKQGKEECHGAPLGNDEIALTRAALKWTHGPFEIPADIYKEWNAKEKGLAAEAEWDQRFAAYSAAFPTEANELIRRMSGELPADFAEKSAAYVAEVNAKGETIASRKASQNALSNFGPLLPEFLGGSADLAGSNLTIWKGCKSITGEEADGNYLHYGVREFGMGAIMNGIALHGGFVPYGATFLIFMEYARNAVRMSALMGIQNIFVYTHDSIGQGEDGPTHQPIEQLTNLRTTPNMVTWRPCDATESAVAWKNAVERQDAPTSLVFSRQGLPAVGRNDEQVEAIAKGAYVLKDSVGIPEAILIATGSEVSLALAAAEQLGDKVRVVSMPSTNIFDAQDNEYKESVLPSSVTKRVAIEAAHTDFWYKYVGFGGKVVGMTTFGESAPGGKLMEHFGFTVENVVNTVNSLS